MNGDQDHSVRVPIRETTLDLPINDKMRKITSPTQKISIKPDGYQPQTFPKQFKSAIRAVNGYQAPQTIHNNYAANVSKPAIKRPPLPTSTLPTQRHRTTEFSKMHQKQFAQPKMVFPQEQLHPSRQNNLYPKIKQTKSDTVYISSSMFADLDPLKLSSQSQDAHVFHFNGATAGRMLRRVVGSERVQALASKNTVNDLFLLTGTNNVDDICSNGQKALRQAQKEITDLVEYLQGIFPLATLHLINILPRTDGSRMNAIYQLNKFLLSFSKRAAKRNLVHIDTYYNKMFSDREGQRRDHLFKSNSTYDVDNVHLNIDGSAKLGAHLKYLAHNL